VVPTAGMDGAYESARARLKAQSKREPGADPGATRFGATRSRSLLSGGTKPKASSDGRERATTVEVVQGADDDIVDAQGRMTRALLHDATGCRDLSSATVADLHNADLTALASGDLDACPNLVSLDLSFNQLVDIDGDALAPLTNLRALIVYNNRVASVKAVARVGQSLQTLQCQNNAITSLDGVEHLRRLAVLNASGNPLGDCKLIGRCTTLTRLDISRCGLEKLEGFATLHALEELNVSGNALTEISAVAKCAKLQELDVSHNALPPSALRDLKALKRLDVLNLEGNALDHLNSMPRMEELTELNCAKNPLRTLPDDFPAKCPELQILDLGECQLAGDVAGVVKALCGLDTLTELRLKFNPCAGGGSGGGHRPGQMQRRSSAAATAGRSTAPAASRPPARSAPTAAGRRIRTAGPGTTGATMSARPPAPPPRAPARPPPPPQPDVSGDVWTPAADPWRGLDRAAAAAATLGYRREVIRALPRCLYLDDVAVGDAERGGEEEGGAGPRTRPDVPDVTDVTAGDDGDERDENDVDALLKRRPQSARRPKAADMSAKAATADGHYEDVAVKFIKEMEDYKTKMSGLIGKIRDGLKETRQEAVAALRSDGTLEAESDAVPSGRLPSAPIVGSVPTKKVGVLNKVDEDKVGREAEAADSALRRGAEPPAAAVVQASPSPGKRPASARAKLVEAQDATRAVLEQFDRLFSDKLFLDDVDGVGSPEGDEGSQRTPEECRRWIVRPPSARGGRPRSARGAGGIAEKVAAAVAAVDAQLAAEVRDQERAASEEEGTRATALAGTSKARPRSGGGNGGAGLGDDKDRRRLRPPSLAGGSTGTLGKVLERTRTSSAAVAASRRPPSSGRLSTSGAAGGRGVPRATFRKPPASGERR